MEDADRERLPRAPYLRVPVPPGLVQMAMLERLVAVARGAVVAPLPLPEHADGQEEDHDPDRLLGAALQPHGQRRLEQDERHPDHQKGQGVAGAPPGAQASGSAGIGVVGRHQRRDRDEVIGVRRVAKPKQERKP